MGKTFDKQQWLETKQARLEAAKSALEDGLRQLETSDDWKRVLAAMARLGRLSIGRLSFTNALLILTQRPGTGQAATFESWRRHGRSVRKGEKAMTIRQPLFRRTPADATEEAPEAGDSPRLAGFRPLSVFALDQTDGPPLPSPTPPDLEVPEAFAESVEVLRKVALTLESAPVSGIEVRPRRPGDHPGARGWFVPSTRSIVVLDEGSRAMQFKVLCHEVAHALLHPKGDHHSAPEREVEAESTAFVVCQALGLETGEVSFPYVASWAHGEDALGMVARSGQRILKAARTMLDALVPEATQVTEESAA